MLRRLIPGIGVFALAMGMAAQAGAVPITGSIGFSGRIAENTDFLTTSFIDIIDLAAGVPGQNADVNCTTSAPCTGTYAIFNALFPTPVAVYNDFSIGPPGAPGTSPVTPLWSVSAETAPGFFTLFSFDLLGVSSVTRNFGGIIVHGFGLAHATGFEDTLASWSFSADTSGGTTFTFSSTTSAQQQPVIPEPGSMMLLGSGLFGLAAAARRRTAKRK